MELSQVIIKPLVTEKSVASKELRNTYAFQVDSRSNKYQIRDAVKNLFNVEVKDVKTINIRGKVKRVGSSMGKRSNWKKALVTLKQDQKIEIFEGVS